MTATNDAAAYFSTKPGQVPLPTELAPPARPESISDDAWAARMEQWTKSNAEYKDVQTGGLGKLALASLNDESAQLTALQLKQQLAGQSLSLPNQTPKSLVNLFV